MTDQIDFNEMDEKKLPTGLNVLTILTFIACAYELYTSIKNFIGGADALKKLDEAQAKMAEAPAWAKQFAGPEMRELLQQSLDNKLPMLIISLVATSLCVYGAIEMRKLKKQGYFLWLIGEILPYISVAIFASAFFKTFVVYFMIFPIIFIILYTVQRKHLVK
jgi:hypothetical protein